MLTGLLSSLLLPIVEGPLQFTGVPLVDHHALPAFGRTEIENRSVILYEHNACCLGKVLPTKGACIGSRQLSDASPYLIFLASLSVSRSIKISPVRIGPLMFLVMTRPLSRPSKILTLTWMTSPVTPVLPIIWVTSAGVIASSERSLAELMPKI